jgi:hypothetical protein
MDLAAQSRMLECKINALTKFNKGMAYLKQTVAFKAVAEMRVFVSFAAP